MAKQYTARNTRDPNKTRTLAIGLPALKKAFDEGVDRCTGPCGCRIEPDGECPQGWPSKSLVAGVV